MARRIRTAIVAAVACCAAAPAFSQPAEGRFRAGFNAGYQAATNSFSDRFTFELYKEQASTDVRYPVKGDVMFDGGAAVRVWKGLEAGVTVSRYTRNAPAQTVSRLPHPLYLDRLREVSGDAAGITRAETGVHVQAGYVLPAPGRLRVTLAGGPSYIMVDQDLVTMIRYDQAYPYDTATFTGANTTRASRGTTGFNVGADVTWMFNRTFGAGGVVRFTRATVKLNAAGNREISVDAGGAQAGAGLRVQF